MEEKNIHTEETGEGIVPFRAESTGFVRKYLKTVITAVLLVAVILSVGIYAVIRKAEVESKQSSFKLTTFEYVITSPTKEQLNTFSQNPAVNKIFPCYNFEITVGGFRFPVIMGDSLENYDLTLFNKDTCISGKADPSGIMLDEIAAERLNVKVGDKVTFSMGGRAVSLNVSGIYMASTYQGLNKGLGLAVFTEEMKSYFENEITYKLAFIDAADEAACGAMLQGYKPLGELKTEEAYIAERKKTDTRPNDMTPEQFEAGLKEAYLEYKAKFEKGSYPAAVQVKSAYMKDVEDQIATRESDVTYIAIILAAAVFAVYTAVGILFIYMNKRDDEIALAEGVPHGKVLREYLCSTLAAAAFVAVVSVAVLIIVASVKHHLAACLPIILLSSLPVLPAAAVVALFAKVYLDKMYSVHVGRAE